MRIAVHHVVAIAVAGALTAWPAVAQQQWTNPHTGRTFNNPQSSFIDTMLLHRQQQMMLQRQLEAMRPAPMAPVPATPAPSAGGKGPKLPR